MDKLNLTFTANINYSSMIRSFTAETAKVAGFDEVWQNRLKLVVDELFMNAIQYGSIEGESNVHVNFAYDEKGFKFSIEDDGSGPKAIPAEELRKILQTNVENDDLTRTSGRGLSMITKAWTDGMKIDSSELGGVKVSFIKNIKVGEEDKNNIGTDHDLSDNVEKQNPVSDDKNSIYEVKLSGEIDQSNITEKTKPVTIQIKTIPEGSVLLIDFEDITYINSMFLVSLAGWHASMQARKGHVRLKNVKNQPLEVLDLVGMTKILDIE